MTHAHQIERLPFSVRVFRSAEDLDLAVALRHAAYARHVPELAAGNTVPAHFIQGMTVEVGGKKVIDAQTGTSVSRNPVFGFKVKGAKAGDKVVVSWVDNKGGTRTDAAEVAI